MLDKSEIECRFRRCINSYEDNAVVQKLIVEHLAKLLKECVPQASRTLEIGCGTGLLSEKINGLWNRNQLYVNDLVGLMCDKTLNRCQLPACRGIKGDIEKMALPGMFDLIVSASTFQWLVRLRAAFGKFAAHLVPQGWLVFSTFGEDNFKELRQITGKGLAYKSIEELEKLLRPAFELVHVEEQRQTLAFSDPLEILRHMKRTGVNISAPDTIWTRGHLREFAEKYELCFGGEGIYPLTYHPIYVACRKK